MIHVCMFSFILIIGFEKIFYLQLLPKLMIQNPKFFFLAKYFFNIIQMFQVFDHNENNCIPIEEMRQVLEYIQANGFFAKVVRGTEIDECLEGLGFNESNKELDVLDFMALMLPAEKVIAYDDKRKLGKSIRRDREKKEKELREIDEDKKINKKD